MDFCARPGDPISENDSLVSVNQHAILDVGTHGAREHDFFQIAPLADEVLHRIAMRDSNHILLDDRPVIENLGDVMTCRANELHPALKRLMVRPGAHEGRKKRMVYVDDALRVEVDELVRQYLHVPRQYHEVRLVLLDQSSNSSLCSTLVVFRDGNDHIRNPVEVGDSLIVRMVRDDDRNFTGQFATLMTV